MIAVEEDELQLAGTQLELWTANAELGVLASLQGRGGDGGGGGDGGIHELMYHDDSRRNRRRTRVRRRHSNRND